MAAKKTPNAEQTVELMVETIRERILDRIDELDIEKVKVSRGKGRGYYKRVGNKDLYDEIGRLEKQLKSLKRGLGGLLTSDPNAKLKSGETWGGFVRSLLDENVQGKELATRLGTFGAFVDQKRKLVPGKVGHHRTGLSVLRDILKDKPFDFRTKFKAIAKTNGYEIGEEFVDFIDPAAHKEFTTNVAGALSKRFGWTKAKEIPQSLTQALGERYAHAMQFGGTNPSRSGFDIPIGYLKDGFDEETLFKFAQPYLEASKRGADAGLQIDDILSKTDWETPEDLIKKLDKVALNQTDDLFDIFGNKLGTSLSAQERRARQVNPEVLKKMGLSIDDINPELLNKGLLTQVSEVAQKVHKLPGVKPTLEVLDVARRNPVITAASTVPIFGLLDAGESFATGMKLWKDDYTDENAEINRLQKLSDQYKFASATTGVSTLNPALAPITGPTSFISGATHLALEHRIHRTKKKKEKIDLFLNPKYISTNTGVNEHGYENVPEIKQRDIKKENEEALASFAF